MQLLERDHSCRSRTGRYLRIFRKIVKPPRQDAIDTTPEVAESYSDISKEMDDEVVLAGRGAQVRGERILHSAGGHWKGQGGGVEHCSQAERERGDDGRRSAGKRAGELRGLISKTSTVRNVELILRAVPLHESTPHILCTMQRQPSLEVVS